MDVGPTDRDTKRDICLINFSGTVDFHVYNGEVTMNRTITSGVNHNCSLLPLVP